MNCQYCQQPCIKDAELYRCYKCTTTFCQDEKGIITTACLYIAHQSKMYYLKLAYNSGTARVYWVHETRMLHSFPIREEVVVRLDTIPEGITPQNLNQKIKFLLTFS